MRWQVRGRDADDHPVKRNFGSLAEAEAFDAELKVAVKAGRYVDERAGRVTLRSRCELWWRSREYDPLTAERVEATFRNHVYEDPGHPGRTPRGSVAIGELPIGLLARQPSRIAAWFTNLPLSTNTRLLLFDLVSAVFETAIADHIIIENPFKTKAVTKPKHVDTDVAAWEPAQLADVAGRLPGRWLPMPLLAAACGHRQGEVFAVALSDINWPRRTCRIEVQIKTVGNRLVFAPIKNDAARTVPIGRPVADLLSAHMRADEHKPRAVTLPWSDKGHRLDGKSVTRELLFTRDDGRALSRSAFNPYWRRAWRAAGIAEAEQVNGFHVCRHSAAAAWLSNGLNIAKVAHFLGDSVAVVSKTYSHFLPSDDERARAIMDEHFSGLAGRQNALRIPFEARG